MPKKNNPGCNCCDCNCSMCTDIPGGNNSGWFVDANWTNVLNAGCSGCQDANFLGGGTVTLDDSAAECCAFAHRFSSVHCGIPYGVELRVFVCGTDVCVRLVVLDGALEVAEWSGTVSSGDGTTDCGLNITLLGNPTHLILPSHPSYLDCDISNSTVSLLWVPPSP